MNNGAEMKRRSILQTGLFLIPILSLLCGCGNIKEKSAGSEDAGAALPQVAQGDSTLQRKNGLLYRNGDLFSGMVVESYADGAKKSITPYTKGRQEGTARGWYPDGTVMFERPYVDGKREGIHKSWWENGVAQSVFHFRKDLHEQNATEWFPDGTLYREFHYEGGQESGGQRMWNEDGTLRANYVVVSGRRYGSMGSKPCISKGANESGLDRDGKQIAVDGRHGG